ncbi:MAG TPA: hypothetical protein VN688_33625 [Gemmataceae bacterium]|nr:hypothetical protein [Gemmataceae bacterium]
MTEIDLRWLKDIVEQVEKAILAAVSADCKSQNATRRQRQMVRQVALANERARQRSGLADIFGNPFRPARIDHRFLGWNDGTIPKLAQVIYEGRAFDHLPILADALEEAGCSDLDILGHLRGPGPHVRGCWVVDLCLGLS